MKIGHRTTNEIIASILKSTNGKKLRMTDILYQTYLSHNLLKKYLLLLHDKGLIDYNTRDRTFSTTPKGIQFINLYEQIPLVKSKEQHLLDDNNKY